MKQRNYYIEYANLTGLRTLNEHSNKQSMYIFCELYGFSRGLFYKSNRKLLHSDFVTIVREYCKSHFIVDIFDATFEVRLIDDYGNYVRQLKINLKKLGAYEPSSFLLDNGVLF